MTADEELRRAWDEYEPSGTHRDAFADGWHAALAATPPAEGLDVDDETLGNALHATLHPGHPWSGCHNPNVWYDKVKTFRAALVPRSTLESATDAWVGGHHLVADPEGNITLNVKADGTFTAALAPEQPE